MVFGLNELISIEVLRTVSGTCLVQYGEMLNAMGLNVK